MLGAVKVEYFDLQQPSKISNFTCILSASQPAVKLGVGLQIFHAIILCTIVLDLYHYSAEGLFTAL